MGSSYELKYLDSLGLHLVKPGLERVIQVLNFLGNPQNNYSSILVAGTNGKGSVASIINTILLHNNYKVGLYTSPHLIRVNERIAVDGKYISNKNLSKYIGIIKTLCSKNDLSLSYFEFLTVISFLYFNEKKIDIAILEVGMGGRWDATNVVNPLVSVITNVTYDHMSYLGSTIAQISEEKAQIIKRNRTVVTGCRGISLNSIRKRALMSSSACYVYGKEFSIRSVNNLMTYKGINYSLEKFTTNLSAIYQRQNIAISLAVIELLISNHNFVINDEMTRKSLLNIHWSGRFQIIDKKNTILVDCAHNHGSVKALVNSIQFSFPGQKFYFLVGMLNDKQHSLFINSIKVISKKILIVDGFSDRAVNADKLACICRNTGIEYDTINDYKNSLIKIIKKNNPLCITGSIYLVGSVLKILYDANTIKGDMKI